MPIIRSSRLSGDYHMGRSVLGLLLLGSYVQAGWISVREPDGPFYFIYLTANGLTPGGSSAATNLHTNSTQNTKNNIHSKTKEKVK